MKKEKFNKNWKLAKNTLSASFAKTLSGNKKKIENFKKMVTDEYNETNDYAVLLRNLKIIAIAEKRMTETAKAAGVKRTSIYKMLSENSQPSFSAALKILQSLGLRVQLSAA
jgi:probable addiction module antidote protein